MGKKASGPVTRSRRQGKNGEEDSKVPETSQREGRQPKSTKPKSPEPMEKHAFRDDQPELRGSIPEVPIPAGKVQCPICGIIVTENLALQHIDVCLEKQEAKPPPSRLSGTFPFPPTRKSGSGNLPNKIEPKKLPKLVYHIIKDKELRRQLDMYGLPPGGERKVPKVFICLLVQFSASTVSDSCFVS